jgi:TRAP-type C4-dicarboxylate transport system permease small subunit
MPGRVMRVFDRVEEGVTLLCFFGMSAAVLVQLVFRFVFNSPLLFPEEVSRYCYVWMTFIGLALATKNREHIRVELLAHALPPRWGRVMGLVVDVASCAMLLFLAYLGVRFMDFSRMNISSALELPLNLVYVSFPAGCALAVVRALRLVATSGGRA